MIDSSYLRKRPLLYIAFLACFALGSIASTLAALHWKRSDEQHGPEEVIRIGTFDGVDLEADATHIAVPRSAADREL